MNKKNFKLGDVFIIPFEGERPFFGLISAMSNHRKVKLLQVRIFDEDPLVLLGEKISIVVIKQHCVLTCISNSFSLDEGRWKVLGEYPGWIQDEWFVEDFAFSTFNGQWFKSIYDRKLNKTMNSGISEVEAARLPLDKILPDLALEEFLKRLPKRPGLHLVKS